MCPGWCRRHELRLTHPRGWTTDKVEFDWDEYLKTTKSVAAPESFFNKMESALDQGYEVGLRLEAVNPENPHQICAAVISRIVGHLLWVHLESEDRWVSVGWQGSLSSQLLCAASIRHTWSALTPLKYFLWAGVAATHFL
jgi:hypothetical protein